jgi:hypothetical protein
MNVLIVNDDNGVGSGALAHGFAALKHDVAMWSPEKMPAYQAFDRQKPDLFIGPTSSYTPAVQRSVGKSRLALWQDESTFFQETPANVFLFSVSEENGDLPYIPWPYLPLAETPYRDEMATDILFLDEYRPGFDAFFMPLFEKEGVVARIHSKKPWPVPYYAGTLDQRERTVAIASTIVCPMYADESRDIRKMYEIVRAGAVPMAVGDDKLLPYGGKPDGYIELMLEIIHDRGSKERINSYLVDLFSMNNPVDTAETLLRTMVTC